MTRMISIGPLMIVGLDFVAIRLECDRDREEGDDDSDVENVVHWYS